MKLPPANINHFWASLIVEELIRNGIDYFCLAPGSRNTPLTVAVAQHPQANISIHYDERGLAFHALGYGRATGKPAAIITTSGTAVPNCMPAVVEAAMERIPMLLLTADRPPELRDTCANQTIDQVHVFGKYVRWFVDLPCPDSQIPCQMVLSTMDQAAYRTCWPEAGAVHVNCMFREPLAPEKEPLPVTVLAPVEDWLGKKIPWTQYRPARCRVSAETLETLTEILSETERGLVVLGGIQREKDKQAVALLLKRLRWPVCADITSGLRMGDRTGTVVAHSDILLRDTAFVKTHRPESVLHLGGRFVSKQLALFLSASSPQHYILATDHPQRQDPGHEVTLRIQSDLSLLCTELSEMLPADTDTTWLSSWKEKEAAANQALDRFAQSNTELSEPAVASLLSQHIPEKHGLFLGSSMPVRDMDMFARLSGTPVPTGANRGASGIDGTLATASGFAAGLQRPVTVFMGDLALLHDLNSLNYLRRAKHPVIAIIINNNGGGIFSFLPIARFESYLEPYFVTPHGLSFAHAAHMYGIDYYLPQDNQGFMDAYRDAIQNDTSAIIEVQIEREKNLSTHHGLVRRMLKVSSK